MFVTIFYDVCYKRTMLPPIDYDTRCAIMRESFEPTKIGFFTRNTNNCCFSNRYNRIPENALRNRRLLVRVQWGVIGFVLKNKRLRRFVIFKIGHCGCRITAVTAVINGGGTFYAHFEESTAKVSAVRKVRRCLS